ncbi:MAG: NUDIX domain-containing protein [Chloroflexota bacterium]
MSFSQTYLGQLRQLVGSRLLLVPGGRAILEDEQERILLVKHRDLKQWVLPGGITDPGESAQESVLREVFEETGLHVTDYDPVGFASDPMHETLTYPNGDTIQVFGLVLYAKSWQGTLKRDANETTDIGFFSLGMLPDMYPNQKRSLDYFLEYKRTGKFQLY